jgi:hypothetical protein
VKNERLTDGTDGFAYRCFSLKTDIVIPNRVQVPGTSCFPGPYDQQIGIPDVIFEEVSQLQRIRSYSLHHRSLKSFCILQLVQCISKSCCNGARIDVSTIESKSELSKIRRMCFSDSVIQSIHIPALVVALLGSCFQSAKIGILIIDGSSTLKQIGCWCSQKASISLLRLPKSLEFVPEFALNHNTIESISTDVDNAHFAIDGRFSSTFWNGRESIIVLIIREWSYQIKF